ncbi:hypothetical protein Bbelb_149390 [Branchiostoma belcheri]|nr:hypothetical protein Bbelb_149390 [Branchiostoma belcheri]
MATATNNGAHDSVYATISDSAFDPLARCRPPDVQAPTKPANIKKKARKYAYRISKAFRKKLPILQYWAEFPPHCARIWQPPKPFGADLETWGKSFPTLEAHGQILMTTEEPGYPTTSTANSERYFTAMVRGTVANNRWLPSVSVTLLPAMEPTGVTTGPQAFSKATPPAELQTTRSKPPAAVTMMSTTDTSEKQHLFSKKTPATPKILNATSTAPLPPEMEMPRVTTSPRAFSKATTQAELQTTRSKPQRANTMMSTTDTSENHNLSSQKTSETQKVTARLISGMHREDLARRVKYNSFKGRYPKATGQGAGTVTDYRHPRPTVPSVHPFTNPSDVPSTPKSPNTTAAPISEDPAGIPNNFTTVAQTTGRYPPAMVQGAFTYSRQPPRAPRVVTGPRAFAETSSPVMLPIPRPKPTKVPLPILPSSGSSEESHVLYQTPGLSQTATSPMPDVHTEDSTPLPKDKKAKRDPPTMVYEAVTAKPKMTTDNGARLSPETGDGASESRTWTYEQPASSIQQPPAISDGPDFDLKPPNTTAASPRSVDGGENCSQHGCLAGHTVLPTQALADKTDPPNSPKMLSRAILSTLRPEQPVALSTTPLNGSNVDSQTASLAPNFRTTAREIPGIHAGNTTNKNISTTIKTMGHYPPYKGQAVTLTQQMQTETPTFRNLALVTQLPESTNGSGSEQPNGTMAPTHDRRLSTITSHISEQPDMGRNNGKRSGSNGEDETKANSRKTPRGGKGRNTPGRKRKTTRGRKSDKKTSQARSGSHGHGRNYGTGTAHVSNGRGRHVHSAKPLPNGRTGRQPPYRKTSGSAQNRNPSARYPRKYRRGGTSGQSKSKAKSRSIESSSSKRFPHGWGTKKTTEKSSRKTPFRPKFPSGGTSGKSNVKSTSKGTGGSAKSSSSGRFSQDRWSKHTDRKNSLHPKFTSSRTSGKNHVKSTSKGTRWSAQSASYGRYPKGHLCRVRNNCGRTTGSKFGPDYVRQSQMHGLSARRTSGRHSSVYPGRQPQVKSSNGHQFLSVNKVGGTGRAGDGRGHLSATHTGYQSNLASGRPTQEQYNRGSNGHYSQGRFSGYRYGYSDSGKERAGDGRVHLSSTHTGYQSNLASGRGAGQSGSASGSNAFHGYHPRSSYSQHYGHGYSGRGKDSWRAGSPTWRRPPASSSRNKGRRSFSRLFA